MSENYLLTEGDINFSESRKNWYQVLDSKTIEVLEEDSKLFCIRLCLLLV